MARPANIHYARADIKGLRSKIKGYSQKYHDAMIRLTKDAAEEFAWRTVQHVGIDTGMSAASLEPLAEYVGTTILDSVAPFVKNKSRPWGTTMSGLSQKGRVRSIDAGFRAGKAAYYFKFGSVKHPVMVFEFKINVWQYAFWEDNWQSLREGIRYFKAFIENNYEDYLPPGLENALNAYASVR